MNDPVRRASAWLRALARELAAASRDEALARAFCALLWLGLLFRLDLYSFTFIERAGPLGVHVGAVRVFKHTLLEPLFALGFVAALGVALRAAQVIWPRSVIARDGVFALGLMLVGFVYGLQRHLIDALNVGVSYELLVEAAFATPPRELLRQLEPLDLLYTFGPAAAFLAQRSLPEKARGVRDAAMLVSLSGLLALGVAGLDEKPLPRNASALVQPPVLFLLADVMDALRHPPERWFPAQPRWSAAQRERMRLDDRAFGELAAGTKAELAPARGHAPSIVVVLMESVGARYVFDDTLAGKTPMPSLAALSKQGLWLARHHSTNNSSPHSIFSILTGLYPLPAPSLFSTTSRVSVPSLFSLLPARYDRFFYSAGPLEWYFPYGLLRNSGVRDIVDESSINGARPRSPTAANEVDAVDAFLARIQRARHPFVGVYYSYVPHYPYRDYDSGGRIVANPARRIERYYNNLRLLDTQIARIVDAARARVPKGELIVLLVGDHGEAFGQHRGNWVHLSQSYEENFQTVALFLNDAIFPPRVETRVTSHVDLLPTLLDAAGVDYPESMMQGASLMRPASHRQYTFVYGNENTLGSIDADGRKVLASFRTGRAIGFDLIQDPREQHPLALRRGDAQLEATLQYRLFQLEQLPRYNDALRRGEPPLIERAHKVAALRD